MARFYIREELRNLLGEDFYQFYRRHRNNRYPQLVNPTRVNATIQKMFSEMNDMLGECNHGIVLKGFGIISNKDSVIEDNTNIFKVKYSKRSKYLIILENEYLQSQYSTHLSSNGAKKEEEDLKKIKKPRPYAVLLHRKKLRKNKLKNDGEDKS